MSEKRLERMENMLSQLINTIGKMSEEQTEIKDTITDIKLEQAKMNEESDKQHKEIMERFSSLAADQDYIWKKAVTNEREFAKFKNQYGI